MQGFPLLRLPASMINDILKFCDLQSIFYLSSLSSEYNEAIKRFTSTEVYNLKVSLCSTEVNDESTTYYGVQVSANGYESFSSAEHFSNVDDVKRVIDYSLDVFNNLHFDVYIGGVDLAPACSFDVLKLLMENDYKFSKMIIGSKLPCDKIYTYLLDNCAKAESLTIDIDPSETFSYDWKSRSSKQFEFSELQIENASWVTAEHLLYLFVGCKSISLCDSRLQSEDVLKFIRRWMEGAENGCNLTDACFSCDVLPRALFPMLKEEFGAEALQEVSVNGCARTFVKEDCFIVQQAEGQKAIVFFEKDYFQLTTNYKLSNSLKRKAEDVTELDNENISAKESKKEDSIVDNEEMEDESDTDEEADEKEDVNDEIL